MKKIIALVLALVIVFAVSATTFASAFMPGPNIPVVSTIDLLEMNSVTSLLLAPLHLLEDILSEGDYDAIVEILLMLDPIYQVTSLLAESLVVYY